MIMNEHQCISQSELMEEEPFDPRSFCYTITSKPGLVCSKKSCPIIGHHFDEGDEECEKRRLKKYKILEKPASECKPGADLGKDGTSKAIEENQKEKTNLTQSGSGSNLEEKESRAQKADEDRRETGQSQESDTALSHLFSWGNVNPEDVITCTCCTCDPCECRPKGIDVDRIVAAISSLMRSSDTLQTLKDVLGQEAVDNLARECEIAGIWSSGGPYGKFYPSSMGENAEFAEMKSCHCLPGMCPCPGGHYLLRPSKSEQQKDSEKQSEYTSRLKEKKKPKKIKKKVKRVGKDGKEYEVWVWVTPPASEKGDRLSETCICSPTKHYLTPVTSDLELRNEFPAPKKRIHWTDLMICSCPRLQKTLVIIKPEAVKFRDAVLRAIRNYGLDVINEKRIQLSPEQASELYAKYYGLPQFPNIIVKISEAPVAVISVGGADVVPRWRNLIGPDGVLPSEWFLPDWISRKYGGLVEIPDVLHGSKDYAEADRENRYFFPESTLEPVMKNEHDVKDYMSKFVNPTLLKGLAILVKEKPAEPAIFLAEWLLLHNPFQPHFPTNVALTPT